MDKAEWIYLVFLGLGGVGAAVHAIETSLNARRRANALRGARLIRDVRDGETVALVGRVVLLKPALRAPFSARDCASFRSFQCQYVDPGGGGMGSNVERSHSEAHSEFELAEKTGRARVVMSGRTIVEDKPAKAGDDGEWECWEWALTEGTRVCVVGAARWEQGATVEGPPDRAPPTAGRPFREAPRHLRFEAERLFSF